MDWGLIGLIVAGLMGRFAAVPPLIPICIVATWCGVQLVRSLGRDLPVLEITACVYCLQLLVCPWIAFQDQTSSPRYQMVVTSDDYFSFVIPTVCAFLIPLCYVRSRLPRLSQLMTLEADDRVFKAGLTICLIGFLFNFIYPYTPISVRFLVYLASEIRFVGALYCYFSRHKQRRMVLALVAGLMLVSSMALAMFHQILIWGAILLSLVIAREIRRPSVGFRLAIVVFGFCGIVVLESFKTRYREILQSQQEPSVLAAVNELATSESFDETQARDVIRVRLNQGWIVSNVLRHIPRYQAYLGGDTFYSAFQDAFIPRALVQKQVAAGGRDNFRKMTGLWIGNNTSMGVSPVGEVYANFGPDGALLAMFAFGMFYAGSYYLLFRWSQARILFALWLPLIFSQAVKCETELAVVLNHLVKAAAFAVIMYPILHSFLLGKARRAIERDLSKTNTRVMPKDEVLVRTP